MVHRSLFLFLLSLMFISFFSCKDIGQKVNKSEKIDSHYKKITEEEFELFVPGGTIQAVLILFGGYPEDAKAIQREFNILDVALDHQIAVWFSNFNQKLWLEEKDKVQLTSQINEVFNQYKIPKDQVYIGGFSSGGVVSLLIGNFLASNKQYEMIPKGLFAVDSPVDLVALYHSSKKNIERKYSKGSVDESTWIVASLEERFGKPDERLGLYEQHAVFTSSTDQYDNLKHLRETKIRLYSEPDTLWWKENRMADYDQMNAYYLDKLAKILVREGYEEVEYITTKNKGFRANGMRHPHSWSIVDQDDLIQWILTR